MMQFTHTHTYNLLTDVLFANHLYWLSRRDPDIKTGTFKYDYNISFLFVSMAIFGPYVIQYASMINAIHSKGLFKITQLKKLSLCKKFYLIFSFTAVGLLIMPLIDALIKVQSILKVFFVLIGFDLDYFRHKGDKTYRRIIQEYMELAFEYFFNLNAFELETFDQ